MRTTAKLLLAFVLMLCSALAAQADPPARAGRLNYLSGTVSFAPAQAPDTWSFATLNRPLTTGDRIWADRDGYAELHVGSTAVRLAPRTNLDILALDDRTLQLRLAQGDANVRVREIADDAIEINTPGGAVLLEEPGSYRISAHPSDDTTTVIVHFGRVQLLTQGGALSVGANQQVTLRGSDGAASEIVAATVDAFDRWSADLDKREDRVAATRYVSPHMTGYEDLDAHGTWRTIPEYGAVWVPAVPAGWAPYRHGHWVWIEPWGWTWIDDAPWGFAPFHYGRWVWLHGHWAWAPGPIIARPVYAPALVAFVGGSHWSVSIGAGPAVGWFPLGWREPFFPWYRTSPTYVRNVNITHVRNINIYNNVTRVNFANQAVPQAVTVVPRDAFVSARPVARERVNVPAGHAAGAPVLRSTPAEPTATSFAPQRAGPRPPAGAINREVFATRTPPPRPAAQNLEAAQPGRPEGQRAAAGAEEPRVRVIDRQRADADRSVRQRAKTAPGEPAPRASAPDPSARPPQAETRPQPKTIPQPQRDAERGRRSADGVMPQAQPDVQRERRAPAPAPESAPRAAPEQSPRAERAPGRPQPRAQPEVERERRAPAPPPDARPRPRPEREPRAERKPAQPEPQARPSVRSDAEAQQRERRPSPAQSRPQRPESPPRAPQPQTQTPRAPQPQMQTPRPPQQQTQPPRPEARGPQSAPSPRAGGPPPREQRNKRD